MQKMKNNRVYTLVFVVLLCGTSFVHAIFDGNYLFELQNATNTEMNNVPTPNRGMMLYNRDENRVYYYNGTQWVSVMKGALVLPKTASYTLVAADNRAVLTFNSSTPVTLTIPSGFPVGYNVSVYQTGTGKVTIVGSATTVLNRLNRFRTAGQDAGVGIVSTANNVYHLTGDLKK